MAYQTGSVAGPNELLQAMSTFLAANGWTVDRDVVSGSGNGRELVVHNTGGGAYYAMRSSNGTDVVSTIGLQDYETNSVETGIWITGGSGIHTPATWYQLFGKPVTNTLRRLFSWMDFDNQAGPFTYHMFAHTGAVPEFFVVAEYTSGRWTFLGFSAALNLLGDWGQGSDAHVGAWFTASRGSFWTNQPPDDTGGFGMNGPFIDANSGRQPNTWIRQPVTPSSEIERETFNGYVDAATGANRFHPISNRFSSSQPERYSYTGRHMITSGRGMGSNLLRATPVAFNLSDVLIPWIFFRERVGFYPLPGGGTWSNSTTNGKSRSFFGYPEHIRYCDMTNLNPGDTLLIGSDTWRVFPDHFKGQIDNPDTWGLEFSQSGFAVKQ